MTDYLYTKHPRRVREKLIDLAKSYKPDLLHLQIQHTTIIDALTISSIKEFLPKLIVTNWTGDVRNSVPITYKRIAKVSDYNFISSTGQIPEFESEIGSEVKYWQIGYNPKLYKPINKNFKYDCVFVGNMSVKENYPGTNERLECCNILRNKYGSRFGLFGNGWPTNLRSRGSANQRELSNIYSESICSISINHYNKIDHYFSDRLLMCMASGRPTVSLHFPKYESYFTHLSDLYVVNSISEIPNAVEYLKNNKEIADYIGESGSRKVYAEHTYHSRVKELLTMVGLL
jgi:spore maturation protein CgeB